MLHLATAAMLCFDAIWGLLGLGTDLGPGWYTGPSDCLTGSCSPAIYDIPMFSRISLPTMWMDAFLIGSLNKTLRFPEIGVSGTGGSWFTISSRRSASTSSDDVMLGVWAATPLVTLTCLAQYQKLLFFTKKHTAGLS